MRQANNPVWATFETIYPAGAQPWSGGSIFLTPVGDYFTPQTPAPAQVFNYLLNVRDTATNNLLSAFAPEEAANWPVTPLAAFAGGALFTCACYDSYLDRWIALSASNSTDVFAATSIDGGYTWPENIGTLTSALSPIAVMARPSDGLIVAVMAEASGAGAVQTLAAGSTTWSTYTGVSIPAAFSAAVAYFNGLFLVVGAQGSSPPTTTGAGLWTSVDGASWLGETSSLPPAFTGLSGIVFGAFTAQSATACMFAISASVSSAVCVTTDGVTYTECLPAGIVKVKGLSYDAANMVWVLTGIDTSGNFKIYTASDVTPGAVTWAVAHVFASGTAGGALACDGGLWLVSLTASQRASQDAIYSQDLGQTWHYCRYRLPAKTSGALPDTVIAGGNQFLAINSNYVTASQCVGSSGTTVPF